MKASRFYSLFTLLTLILAVTIYLVDHYLPENKLLSPDVWGFLVFFAGITFLAYRLSMAGIKQGGESSVFFILGGVVLKLLLSMVFALVYIYTQQVDKIQFISNFFILYFIYTAFEMYSLMYNLRAQKK